MVLLCWQGFIDVLFPRATGPTWEGATGHPRQVLPKWAVHLLSIRPGASKRLAPVALSIFIQSIEWHPSDTCMRKGLLDGNI